MARRRKKKNNSRKIWFVLILLCAVSLLGWKIWTSDEVQMRFVYMWPYQGEILEYSGKNKIDPFLVAAVIKNESNFDRKAVSKVGAIGLMQIMPDTGKWIAGKLGMEDFEEIRERLRSLMKYIPTEERNTYITHFTDEILSMDWNKAELDNDELKNYKERAEFYIREHQDNIVIAKLKTNKPLTENDIDSLEEILWKEIGTKQDYENEIGQKPLGEFVREIVGLDMNAAKEAFSAYLSDTNMDSRQIYFVNQIIEYIVHNGMLKDLSVLQESPFTDQGSIVDIFTDLSVWMGIRGVIDQINANAAA